MRKIFIIILFFGLLSNSNAQETATFYFDNNKFELNKTEQTKFDKWILENKTSKILSITGSTDEVGTSASNDTLSLRRVNFIFSKIKNKVAIRDDFKSISLGESGATSAIKSENRKAIIHYLLQKDLDKENEILGIKPIPNQSTQIIPIEEEDMNFPENANLEEKINLSKRGTLIRLNDINFYINSFGIMPTSKRAIDELIFVMNKYPKLKIEIQGHICCVKKDATNLSSERAKQVRRILVSEGISERRIGIHGFGVSKPKFAIPEKSECEAARNRRVEIMILDK